MTDEKKPGRLLWNDPSVIAYCALALAVTVAIIVFQIGERQGLFDPTTVTIFYRLFLFQDYPGSLLLIAVLLLGLLKPVQRAGAGLARLAAQNMPTVAACTFVCLAVGALWIYQAYPLAMDEYVPYLQSQIFVAGRLLGQFPPALVDWLVYPSFQGYFIHISKETGELASAYWPGFALLLTPFTAAGVPWLCNPVLGVAAVLVIHRLTWSLTQSGPAAGTAVLFTLASPAFVINAISFYSMTAHLLCNAAFVLLLLKPTPVRAALAGLVGGLALTLHNPVPHMLFAAPWLLWLLLRRDPWRLVAAIGAGYLPFVVVVGFGWQYVVSGLSHVTAGAAASSPGVLDDAVNTLSGVLAWPNQELLQARLIGLMKLWIWAAPAMILLAGIGFWRRRDEVQFRLMLGSMVLTLIGYLFVPASQGHGWGFRYFHAAWFVIAIFAATAVAGPRQGGVGNARLATEPLVGYAQGAAFGGLLLMVPFFAWHVHSFINEHLAQLPTADHGRPRMVIVSPFMQYYAQDLAQNDPFLRSPVIRMVTRGRRQDERMIARHFPDLVLLSRSYQGSVWGHRDVVGQSESAGVAVRGDKQRE